MDSPTNIADRERLLDELARREAGEPGDTLAEADESTLAAIKAEFDLLLADLREPPPIDAFEDESGCRRAVELAKQVGPRSDDWLGASDAADLREPVPERIGPYRITARLGRGGMGTVYRAVHDKLKRVVAVKVLATPRLKDAGAIARFEREMEAIGALDHPNIVTAHDAGEVGGMHYLVMECVEGLDLATLMQRTGALAIADACEIVRQAAQGLKAANERGIVHRDLKPSNLMLARGTPEHPEATVKILDFGLARLAPLHADLRDLTYSGQIMGTLKYMAPEQCSSSRDVDGRADVYSLGATLYKLLCGSAPFSRDDYASPLALLAALASQEPSPLLTRRPDLPAKLAAVVHRMMAKSPDNRTSSPQEVIDALAPWARGANLAELLEQARGVEDPGEPETDPVRLSGESHLPTKHGSSRANRRALRRALPAVLLGLNLLLAGGAAIVLIPAVHRWWAESAPTAASRDPFQQSRRASEWVLSQGGSVEIGADDTGSRALGPGDDLPKGIFHLISASLAGNQTISGEDLERFANHPFLYSLMLNQTPLDDGDLRHLGSLPMLRCLYLSETRVTDAGLADLKRYRQQLTHLHLQGTAITDAGLVHIAEFRNLTELYLLGCRVSDKGLTHLTDLKELKTLWLGETEVTAAGIVGLKRALPDCFISSSFSERQIAVAIAALQDNAPSTNASDATTQDTRAEEPGPTAANGVDDDSSGRDREVAEWLLARAGEIRVTTAAGGLVTLDQGEELPNDFRQLIMVNVDNNVELTDEDLARFDGLPSFTALSVGWTKIGDAGLGHLGELPELRLLFLPGVAVTDDGLAQLRRFPKLEVLHLQETQVTDAGLVHLAGLVQLFDLSLGACNVTDEGLKQLTALKRLQILALNRTLVTPAGIVTLQASLPNCEIRSDFSEEELNAALETLPKSSTQIENP